MATNPNMEAIETITVGATSVANITFSNIPQTYTDLFIVLSLRADSGTSYNDTRMTINSSTSGYTSRLLYGTGSGTGSANNNSYQYAYWVGSATTPSYTASTFSNIELYIPNYSSSNNKSASVTGVAENNGTLGTQLMTALLWANSNAITSLSFTQDYGNYVQYSSATLYGITAFVGGQGGKATGGTVTSDSNYWYHTFTSSGMFIPNQSVNVDYLVVSGGGGGGSNIGSGGGAGGLKTSLGGSQLALTAQSYTVLVGAGGSAGYAGTSNGLSGSGSILGSISTSGGGYGVYYDGGVGKTGGNGGSGGGGGAGFGSGGTAGTGVSGEGNNGGAGQIGGPPYRAGSGGGAGAAGTTGGNGGAGVSNSITGSSVTYAGGGGSGTYNNCLATLGGSGGGGNGNQTNDGVGGNATANTGGGGGGGGLPNVYGGNGGSGIVIVRYAK